MAPVRLRHPKGVSTIQVDFEQFTVLDLQKEIFTVTEIPLSLQECAYRSWMISALQTVDAACTSVKAGYPPHALTLVPELPIDSLGLKQGEQLIVTQRAEATHRPAATMASATASTALPSSPAASVTGQTASQVRRPETPPPSTRPSSSPDYVQTEGGYLVHRVCFQGFYTCYMR